MIYHMIMLLLGKGWKLYKHNWGRSGELLDHIGESSKTWYFKADDLSVKVQTWTFHVESSNTCSAKDVVFIDLIFIVVQ